MTLLSKQETYSTS